MSSEKENQFKQTEIGLLPENWNLVLLKDACSKIGSGLTPRGAEKVYKTKGITLIRSQNVLNSRFVSDGLVYIDENIAKEMENVEVLRQDVLLNITGDSVARCCTVPDYVLPARVNQHVSIVRTNAKHLDPVFLRYYLTSPKMQSYMLSLAQSGGTRNALTKGMIENFVVPKPDVKEQKEIADILSNLDSKISLNSEMNETLEAIGKTIFRRWFVDFEFPNEEGKPYKSSGGEMTYDEESGRDKPKEWETKKIGAIEVTVTDFVANGSFASLKNNVRITETEDFALFIRNIDLKNDFSTRRYVTESAYKFLSKSQLHGGEVIISNVGDVGSVYLCPFFKKPMTLGNNIILIRSNGKRNFNYYLYHLFKSKIGQNLIESITTGSVQMKFNKTDFRNLNVFIPERKLLEKFNGLIESLWRKIRANKENTSVIQTIRDSLLPKLMSGKIRVPVQKEDTGSQ